MVNMLIVQGEVGETGAGEGGGDIKLESLNLKVVVTWLLSKLMLEFVCHVCYTVT
jgi:hypothetical protein